MAAQLDGRHKMNEGAHKLHDEHRDLVPGEPLVEMPGEDAEKTLAVLHLAFLPSFEYPRVLVGLKVDDFEKLPSLFLLFHFLHKPGGNQLKGLLQGSALLIILQRGHPASDP